MYLTKSRAFPPAQCQFGPPKSPNDKGGNRSLERTEHLKIKKNQLPKPLNNKTSKNPHTLPHPKKIFRSQRAKQLMKLVAFKLEAISIDLRQLLDLQGSKQITASAVWGGRGDLPKPRPQLFGGIQKNLQKHPPGFGEVLLLKCP